MNNQKHMTLNDRCTIESELNNRSSFKQIALLIAKDKTTISKEIRKHISKEQTGSWSKGFNDCVKALDHSCELRNTCISCTHRKRPCWSCGKCTASCILHKKYICPKLSKPPYVCNGCTDRAKCTLEKSFYRAKKAQDAYELLRSESRSGFAVTEEELKHLDSIISPRLMKGQSIHHICVHHSDELMTSERSIYTYVGNGLLTARNLDMPRTVRMRPRKAKPKPVKIDKTCRIGRTYEDFKHYLEENPDTPVVQCDSVEGIKGGAVLLTLHFVQQGLQLAFKRESNDSQSVIDIINKLYLELFPDIFMELFPILLCDNGSEFSNPKALEYDFQGNQRTRGFYCNPNAPYEKANCENNHEMIRRIIPKGVDIGQYSQDQISLMMNHINSYSRKKMGNKSAYEVFAFQYNEDILNKLGLRKISPDEIILSPVLLK